MYMLLLITKTTWGLVALSLDELLTRKCFVCFSIFLIPAGDVVDQILGFLTDLLPFFARGLS